MNTQDIILKGINFNIPEEKYSLIYLVFPGKIPDNLHDPGNTGIPGRT